MDYIINELFGGVTEPLELALRLFIVILLFDGLFGVVEAVLRPVVVKN